MANEEHLAILKQGVEAWNRWREEHPNVEPDLSGAHLSGVHLSGAHLSRAHLDGADLRGAHLSRAHLTMANLFGADLWAANLSETNLSEADLWTANLSRANLSEADLSGANLHGANLHGANLSEALIGYSLFGDVDLSVAKELDTVVHYGPSTIGIDTIYKSHGKIPEAFLRGCGVPDDFIAFAKSLACNPIEFYSCFISYSTKDQEFAERLHNDLQGKNVRCWFAPEDVQGGRKLHEQIDEAIRYHDKLLLILSESSMNSEWVKTEIRRARKQEAKAGRRKLFPISLVPYAAIREWEAFDADIGKDMAVEIREYFVPDFTCWKDHDAYKNAFDRLLRDLRAEPN